MSDLAQASEDARTTQRTWKSSSPLFVLARSA